MGTLSLQFSPQKTPKSLNILVFVNDEEGNNEDTIAIKAVFAPTQ